MHFKELICSKEIPNKLNDERLLETGVLRNYVPRLFVSRILVYCQRKWDFHYSQFMSND